MIESFLKNRLPVNNKKITFMFSGRVAIHILGKKLKKNGIVLIPNYICNVVDKAFENDYEIIRYKLDDFFEPDIKEIIYHIINNKIDVLLVASLYGSGKFLSKLCDSKTEVYKVIKKYNIEVIIDLAQDFYRINNLNLNHRHLHYVFSFNDKSFMGAMGGLIISNYSLSSIKYLDLSMVQKFYLLKVYLLKFLSCKIPFIIKLYQFLRGIKNNNNLKTRYEFSNCDVFPYAYNNFKISTIQLWIAFIGIRRLKLYYKKKKIFLMENKDVIQNEFVETAAYVILKEKNVNHKYKRPYSYYNNELKSLYPDLNISHNKGFCDK